MFTDKSKWIDAESLILKRAFNSITDSEYQCQQHEKNTFESSKLDEYYDNFQDKNINNKMTQFVCHN